MYKRFKLRKKRKRKLQRKQKRRGFWGDAAKSLVIFSVILNNETKKKLCDDEIKCSKKGRTTKW